MTPALWLLLALQLKGWVRYLFRNLRTVKGSVLALVGLAVMVLWCSSLLMVPQQVAVNPDDILTTGPVVLLLYCLFNVVVSTGEKVIYFSPAEVNLLFSGPFSPRQILGYKVLNTDLLTVPTSLILTVVFRVHSPSFLSAYVGVLLGLIFMNSLTLALNLIGITIGASLYTRLRKGLLTAVLLIAAGFFFFKGASWWQEVQSLVWPIASWPLRTFFEAFLAARIWPDLVYWGGMGCLVNIALLGVVFSLPANYLETAAASSAQTFARIQKLRSGNILAGDESGGGKVRFRLPDFPYWGGIGPIMWRQMTVAMRGLRRLTILLVIFGIWMAAVMFPVLPGFEKWTQVLLFVEVFTMFLTIMLASLVTFDFRGDLDRMAVLKALPISSWRLTIGQVLTPTLLVSCVQWLVLGAVLMVGLVSMEAVELEEKRLLALSALVVGLFVFPFNFLLFGLENLLFLLFPARVMASQPGDFQAIGRNVLFVLAKLFGLALVFGVAFLPALGLSLVSGNLLVGLAWAWMVLVGSAVLTVPLVALAFTWFDVGRDTPP
jgi:hypothetical protein